MKRIAILEVDGIESKDHVNCNASVFNYDSLGDYHIESTDLIYDSRTNLQDIKQLGLYVIDDEAEINFPIADMYVQEIEMQDNGISISSTSYVFENNLSNKDEEKYILKEGEALGGWNVIINDVEINDDVFQNQMTNYDCVTRESKIEDLQGWIKEKLSLDPQCSDFVLEEFLGLDREEFYSSIDEDREELEDNIRFVLNGDGNMMLSDLRELQDLEDEFIMSSNMTNEYVAFSDSPSIFNEICEDILEANQKLENKIVAEEAAGLDEDGSEIQEQTTGMKLS